MTGRGAWLAAAGATGTIAVAAAGVAALRRARGRDRSLYRPAQELVGAWDDETYQGEATLTAGETELTVRIHLGGNIQPLDGSYRWYGRITRDEAVTELHANGVRDVSIRVPGGPDTPGTLAEIDPFGNARVTGTGHPPHPLDDPLAEETGSAAAP